MDYLYEQVKVMKEYLPELKIEFNLKDVVKMSGGIFVGVVVVYCGWVFWRLEILPIKRVMPENEI